MNDGRGTRTEVRDALERARTWLLSMRIGPAFRMSAAHDPHAWPGSLLVGTYDAVLALGLTGGLEALDQSATLAFIKRHRLADGGFANPDVRPGTTFKRSECEETERYIAWHVTNYCHGAQELLEDPDPRPLPFAEPFLDPVRLGAWLALRDLRDPWLEGNNIVNLASFLMLAQQQGEPRATAALHQLVDWHRRLQEPATGFWGVGQTHDPKQHLHAMAGATHNLHLFYALDAPIAHAEAMVDYCLSLSTTVTSACLDVDPVDILVHLAPDVADRRAVIGDWLIAKLEALLACQNEDGGFADRFEGKRRLDGWVEGYVEPQGLSNTFATFFRCLAIALVADTLWPGWRHFCFRRGLGIGFRKHATDVAP